MMTPVHLFILKTPGGEVLRPLFSDSFMMDGLHGDDNSSSFEHKQHSLL